MSEFKLSEYFKDHRQELTREVTTPQGLTVKVSYVHDDKYEALKHKVEHIRNPKAKEISARKNLLSLMAGAVLEWNMTPEIMAHYLPADTSQMPETIPCDREIVMDLLEESDTFFGQISSTISDLEAFRAEELEEEGKN